MRDAGGRFRNKFCGGVGTDAQGKSRVGPSRQLSGRGSPAGYSYSNTSSIKLQAKRPLIEVMGSWSVRRLSAGPKSTCKKGFFSTFLGLITLLELAQSVALLPGLRQVQLQWHRARFPWNLSQCFQYQLLSQGFRLKCSQPPWLQP